MPQRDNNGIEIQEGFDRREWEKMLAGLEGAHALQTWLWGAAKEANGDTVLRLFARRDGVVVGMAQVFGRRIVPLGPRAAWVPQGPAWMPDGVSHGELAGAFKSELRRRGFHVVIGKPYAGGLSWRRRLPWQRPTQTFWIDLTRDLADLERSLAKQWRANRNRFLRSGAVIEDPTPAALEEMVRLHTTLAGRKGFAPSLTAPMAAAMARIVREQPTPCVTMHVLRATVDGACVASGLFIRAGQTAHPIASGFDYQARRARPSEALIWAAVERFKRLGVCRFDTEGGADQGSSRKSGVSEFKRHMGGALVELPPLAFEFLF